VIVSPATAYGTGDGGRALAHWLADSDAMIGLGRLIASGLAPTTLHGVKILIGGSPGNRMSEVRIDGVVSDDASSALRAVAWQTPAQFAVARRYVLLVPDQGTAPTNA
jgi:hypothetical protein